MANQYQAVGDEERRAYNVTAQAGSMATKLLHTNVYHFLNGYPPLELTGAATPAVRVTGLRLRDFPLIRREWDPANPEDPDELPASYQRRVGWICAEDPSHRWTTDVFMRTARLTGCPQCRRLRGAAVTVKPDVGRVELQRIRDAWGDLEDPMAAPPIPVVTAAVGTLEQEDF